MTAPRCDGCLFYVPLGEVGDRVGDCRRLPPVVVVVEAMSTEYPLVPADSWCGEHRPIEPDPTPAWERLWAKPDHMAAP